MGDLKHHFARGCGFQLCAILEIALEGDMEEGAQLRQLSTGMHQVVCTSHRSKYGCFKKSLWKGMWKGYSLGSSAHARMLQQSAHHMVANMGALESRFWKGKKGQLGQLSTRAH
jgi:hypothetical protein